jgi:hypothetical protein
MATQQDQLIQAIRRIAKSDPEIRSLLTVLQKRGALDGLVKLVGGSDAAALEDCCTDSDDADPEDAEPEDISEDAPPEVPDIGDEDGDGESEWSDCETGDPITFAPGGFPQPETCKEFVPDETWEQGKYWIVSVGSLQSAHGAGLHAAIAGAMDNYNSAGGLSYTVVSYNVLSYTGDSAVVEYSLIKKSDGTEASLQNNAARVSCLSSTEEYCTITTPPEIRGENWQPDNTTNYTLADGCITASSCDPDASTQSQQCNECITICNEDGEERRVCAIGNGQWILYDQNGKYKGGRYDATGRRLEILPAGETGGYLPSEAYDGSYDGGTIGGGDGWVWS